MKTDKLSSLNKYLRAFGLLLASMFFSIHISSQNLVNNASFENHTSPIDCNSGGGFYNLTVIPAVSIVNDWLTIESADYFVKTCNNNSERSAPLNFFGYSQPKNGNAYAGLIAFAGIGIESKEYIYQQLNAPLVAGEIYCLSFYISLAEISNGAIKNVGAHFCNAIPSSGTSGYLNVTPQIENQGTYLTDTTGWYEIQGCFTATGGEQFLIIGNFNSNANTDTIKVNTNSTSAANNPRYSYYFIDDIILYKQSTVGLNEHDNFNGISIYPNPTKDILNIDLTFIKENARIEIYNYLGETVWTERLKTQKTLLQTNHFQNGVYYYCILIGDQIIKKDKIIIID